MAMAEDHTAFFSAAEFADNATLNGAGVVGIFDQAYEQGTVGLAGMSSGQPVFTLPSSSVPAGVVGKSLVLAAGLGAGSYLVAESQPDGTGLTVLVLERTA
jgi:hypothetical protein